ncbi:MAG: hypothetical protein NTZ08_04785 [Verrucomicrobia bacterium]|nr:hypothetical protein [Verrucomicrobiota bacterium]
MTKSWIAKSFLDEVARGSAIRNLGGSILRHDPNFSREAAFLLDAMAALPRKSDPGGAASLPWQMIALTRGSAIRNLGGFIVLA